jgi:hypothetical protein
MSHATKRTSLPDEKLEVVNDTHGLNIDPAAEKLLVRKCDLHVLPPLFVLFLVRLVKKIDIACSNIHIAGVP